MGTFDFLKPSRSKPAAEFKPFKFYSDKHQRYENGQPVYELQQCGRTFTVEKNVNGCDGYIIEPGVGYIVRAINDDTGREQFAPKPMKIVSQSSEKVELRGYMTKARTPFGYVDFDVSDYGLVVYYKGGRIDKCVFHMYDRDVYIEYMGSEQKPGLSMKTDKYSKIIDESTFNPFKITTDPRLNANLTFPELTPVFRKELEDLLDKLSGTDVGAKMWGNMVAVYAFRMIESYYKNAGYVPKVIMDKILEQIFNALRTSRYASRFAGTTLIDLKDKMYHDLTTKKRQG